jgi:hypothetical protein
MLVSTLNKIVTRVNKVATVDNKVATGCGSAPLDCGCARSLTITTSGLSASTDPIILDGSHTAAMPTLSDFSNLTLDVTTPGCYIKSISLGTASVTGSGSGSFDLYLMAWWDTGTGTVNVAVIETATGASWDNLAVVFFGSFEYTADCCAWGISGTSSNVLDNQLPESYGAVNDVINLNIPSAMVDAGLFTSTSQSFVIAGDSGEMTVKIICYVQARSCVDDALIDAWFAYDDAPGGTFILPGGITCCYVDRDDPPSGSHGTLYGQGDIISCNDLGVFIDCTDCSENICVRCGGARTIGGTPTQTTQPPVTVSGGTGTPGATWQNICITSCDFSGSYDFDGTRSSGDCEQCGWQWVNPSLCATVRVDYFKYNNLGALLDRYRVTITKWGGCDGCDIDSGFGVSASDDLIDPATTDFSCVDGVLTGTYTINIPTSPTDTGCSGTVTLVFG